MNRRFIRLRDFLPGPRSVDPRCGDGRLDPAYELLLRARVHDEVQSAPEEACVHGTSSADPIAAPCGEEPGTTVASGEDRGAASPERDGAG